MIVETKFRDITFEQALECIQPEVRAKRNYEARRVVHDSRRGQSVEIVTPPIAGSHLWACDGPFYQVNGKEYSYCIHWLEIGD